MPPLFVTLLFRVSAMGKQRDVGEIEKHLSDALAVVDGGMKRTWSSQVYYIVGCLLSFVALMFISTMSIHLDFSVACLIVELARMAVMTHLVFCAFMAIIVVSREHNALLAARKDINWILKSSSLYG